MSLNAPSSAAASTSSGRPAIICSMSTPLEGAFKRLNSIPACTGDSGYRSWRSGVMSVVLGWVGTDGRSFGAVGVAGDGFHGRGGRTVPGRFDPRHLLGHLLD